jgi:hypothetical protein
VYTQLAAFELSPPHAFAAWRDITYLLLHDIGLHSTLNPPDQPEVFLDSFFGIHGLVVNGRKYDRVTIGSSSMSFSDQSDGITVGIPSNFIDNGLSFKMYDCIGESWATDSFSESSSTRLCTAPLPESGPYTSLHDFVSGTGHTPNDILVSQADCPEAMNLHEYIAFAGLRSCPRLQWLNIARELASPFLSFRREEVHTLITQAAWQLGPLSDGVREWHIELTIPGFGNALLLELESLLEKIKPNWQEEVTVRTIGVLDISGSQRTLDLICY